MNRKSSVKNRLITEIGLLLIVIASIFIGFTYYYQRHAYIESFRTVGNSHSIYFQSQNQFLNQTFEKILNSPEDISSDPLIKDFQRHMDFLPDSYPAVKQTYLMSGEQGKGFAVVADEVSKLAEKSTRSAKQIPKN